MQDCDGTDQYDITKRGTWRGRKRLVILSKKLDVIGKEVEALKKVDADGLKMKETDVKNAMMKNEKSFSQILQDERLKEFVQREGFTKHQL